MKKLSVAVSGFEAIELEQNYGHESGFHLRVDNVSPAETDDTKAEVYLYAEEAKALRDALIELYPLGAAAQPAEPEQPKVTYEASEQQQYDRYGNLCKKPVVYRIEPSTRSVAVASFEVRTDAEAYAELMNSK